MKVTRLRTSIIFILFSMLVFSFALTGCGGSEGEGEGEETYTMRLAHPMAPGNNVTLGYEKFKELAEEKSDGQIEIELYPNTQLGSDRETMESVQAGNLEMASSSSPNMASFSKKWMAFDLPYITTLENQEKLYAALDDGELGDYYRELSKDLGFKLLMFSEYGYRNFVTTDQPINEPSDLEGLKLRTTASEVEVAVAKALGATPTPMAWGEVYTSLQQGTIDGEGNTFGLLHTAKHHEALNYAATTNHNYSMHILNMNLDYWNSLPEDIQQIIEESAQEALEYEREISNKQEEEAKQAFKDAGIEVNELSPEELEEWKEATQGVWDEFEDEVGEDLIQMIVDAQK